jgi:hypothetical protein
MNSSTKVLCSRDSAEDSANGIALNTLDLTELELISALLGCVKLGHGVSPWTDAAYNLITKIMDLRGDDFIDKSATAINFEAVMLNAFGQVAYRCNSIDLEISV